MLRQPATWRRNIPPRKQGVTGLIQLHVSSISQRYQSSIEIEDGWHLKKNALLSGRKCTPFAPCMVYVVLRNGFMLQVETQNHPRDELWVYPTWYVYNTWIDRYVCRYICIYVYIHILLLSLLLLLLLLYFLCAASPRFPPSDLLQVAPLFDLSLLRCRSDPNENTISMYVHI